MTRTCQTGVTRPHGARPGDLAAKSAAGRACHPSGGPNGPSAQRLTNPDSVRYPAACADCDTPGQSDPAQKLDTGQVMAGIESMCEHSRATGPCGRWLTSSRQTRPRACPEVWVRGARGG
jgi:hypothetical protein